MKTKRGLNMLGGFLGWFVLSTLVYALLNLPDPSNRQLNTNMAPIWSGIILANFAVLILLAIFSKAGCLAFGWAIDPDDLDHIGKIECL